MSQNPSPSLMMSPTSAGPNGGNGAGPGSGRFTPLDPIRILRQYKWLLVLAVIIGVGAGVGVYFVLLKYQSEYSAEAQVGVKPKVTNVADEQPTFANEEARESFKRTQALFMQTRGIMTAAMADLRNQSQQIVDGEVPADDVALERARRVLAWFAQWPGDEAYREASEMISVRPIAGSEVIEVSARGEDPLVVAAFANALVNRYIEDVNRANERGRDSIETLFLRRQNEIEQEIGLIRRRLQESMSEIEYSQTEAARSEVEKIFNALIEEQHQVEQALSSTYNRVQTLKRQQVAGVVEFSEEDRFAIDNDPAIEQVNARIRALKQELRVAEQRFGPNHRSVVDLKRRIAAAEDERELERQRLLDQLQSVKLARAETDLEGIKAMMAKVDADLAELRPRRQELAGRMATHDALRAELEQQQENRDNLAAMLNRMDLIKEHPEAITAELFSPAFTPDQRSYPKPESVIPGVTILFTLLVAGLVFLKELLDSRIKGPSCTRLLPVADLLGVIPAAREDPNSGKSIELVVARDPQSLLAESFRQLRTEVLSKLHHRRFKSLMLTGAQPGSGTTAILGNLGASAALNQRRVLIIDANFRRPAQHEVFGVERGPGLGEVLSGEVTLEQAIATTEVENLDLMPIGESDGTMLERLESERFTQLLRDVEKNYDVILVDAPPLAVVGDSRVLANRVDAIMLTVRAMREKRGLVGRMIRQLIDARGEFLGLVLNGVRSSSGGYFRRNYEAFYEYQNGGSGHRRKQVASRSKRRPAAAETP